MAWQTVEVETRLRSELVDVTAEIARIVTESGVREGVCHIYVAHTTAGVLINEYADPSVARDILAFLTRLVPATGDYKHAEGNSDAHIKSVLVGPAKVVPVQDGRLALGTWQGIFFAEFDGPRRRKMLVKVFEKCEVANKARPPGPPPGSARP
ncbi:secondary thiamine-phosphate synthase enzyme YjbQ [Desulforudis sp. 1088]|uniref:secondary thiamine-phosphate synthase enzyme YjbQ n=1 Tax=unclassified Candidatus Desulforudis TaxID=2635950 RepID=UPI003CE5B156